MGEVKWNQIVRQKSEAELEDLLPRETWWGETDPVSIPDEAYCDNWIARNGLDLLKRAPEDGPWHLVLNFVGPHPPMDITNSMASHYRGPDRVIDRFEQPHDYDGPFPPEQHIRIRQNYAAMIENIDRWLGVFVRELEARATMRIQSSSTPATTEKCSVTTGSGARASRTKPPRASRYASRAQG